MSRFWTLMLADFVISAGVGGAIGGNFGIGVGYAAFLVALILCRIWTAIRDVEIAIVNAATKGMPLDK